MKIALLAPGSAIHTVRWANGLSSLGHHVILITQHELSEKINEKVELYILKFKGNLGYFINVPEVKKILKLIKPDILNAHYASGYGTTARLVNFHPYIISVWGSDIYDFPEHSFIHKLIIKKNLQNADKICSTSKCMAEQTLKILPTGKSIQVIPFGIEIDKFNKSSSSTNTCKKKIIVGTIKTMNYKYGIDVLIKSFALTLLKLKNYNFEIDIELHLIGGGDQLAEYVKLTETLKISNKVKFFGKIPHDRVPLELEKIDIFVALSRLESFGVAILEAGAAGKPVVVSDVGGLPEVVIKNETGIIVSNENIDEASDAIAKLVINENLRLKLGANARSHVQEKYDWNYCLKNMTEVYNSVISKYNKT